MSRQPMTDAALREMYDRLLRERGSGAPDISVETVQALASGSYAGADRIELLDRVLSNPVTARELRFFGELASQTPPARSRRMMPLALAATLLLSAGAVTVWTLTRPPVDQVRGEPSGFALVEPGREATVARGTRFVWRSAPGAASYRLELVDGEGNLAFSAMTADTAVVLPDSLSALAPGVYLARVHATLRDGTTTRSSATRLRVP